MSVNLIVNGDFSQGNTGFTTGYNYISPNQSGYSYPGDYSIVFNPQVSFTDGYLSYGDHTSGSGQMLFADGTTGEVLWQESPVLAADTTYVFSYYITGADAAYLPDIQTSVNGVPINGGVQVTSSGGGSNWQLVTEGITTTTAGAYTISLSDLNGSATGNDPTIDDLALVQAPAFSSQNLIVNGDFSQGNSGFTSDYGLDPTNGTVFTNVGQYAVVTNPNTAFTNNYLSYGDHTSGNGNMLFADGQAAGSFWKESVTLAANTTYRFTYFVTGADPTSLPSISVSANGAALDNGFQVSDSGGTWQQATDIFTSGAAGTYAFAMSDLNNVAYGNDFTIDDIALNAEAACYLRGVRILTARGEVAIERLAVGDHLVTASGALRPVRWLGHRALDVSRHPDPAAVRPVRIRAGAFGAGLPRRDLWVSPGHNIAFEGSLVAAALLVNGRSVTQEHRDCVEYWHVELDAHDVILAEGLAAESYLDTGNRTAFENGGAFVEAHPDFRPRHWADTCLPVALEGHALEAAKARLLAQLEQEGEGLIEEADAHVVVDGRRIEPIRLSAQRLVFVLPEGGRKLALRPQVFVPAHAMAQSRDDRTLGLCVGALQIDGAAVRLEDDANAASGWARAEFSASRFSHRWTDGDAQLPPGARLVMLDLAGAGRYWRQAETSPNLEHDAHHRQASRN